MIQAASPYYTSSRGHGHRPRPRTLETASTEKEARRVLQWQQDVARSVSVDDSSDSSSPPVYQERIPPPASIRRSDTYPAITPPSHHSLSHSHNGSGSRVLRRETVTTESYRRHHGYGDSGEGERGNGGGMSKGAIIGTLLGAAAGAAVAYAMVRSESPERASPPRRESFAAHRGVESSYPHRGAETLYS